MPKSLSITTPELKSSASKMSSSVASVEKHKGLYQGSYLTHLKENEQKNSTI